MSVPSSGASSAASSPRLQPFHDPDADAALVQALKQELGDRVELHEEPDDVNAPTFAVAMADRLHELIEEQAR